MKRAVLLLQFNEADSFANIEAEHFALTETHLLAYKDGNIVGAWLLSTVVSAHISTKENAK